MPVNAASIMAALDSAQLTTTERISVDDKILASLYGAIEEVNAQRPGEPPLAPVPETALYGSASALDSLGLVNFIVAVEQRIEADFGVPIVLADDRALARQPSPFESVGALAEYIQDLLRERE